MPPRAQQRSAGNVTGEAILMPISSVHEDDAQTTVGAKSQGGGMGLSGGGLGATAPMKETNQMVPAVLCAHGQTDALAYDRWGQLETLILSAPEHDQDAQWDAIGACNCCGGPAKQSTVCTRCTKPQTIPESGSVRG